MIHDPLAGLVVCDSLARALPKGDRRVSAVFLELVLGRVSKGTGWPVEVLRRMLPAKMYARKADARGADLPAKHYRHKAHWQDRLAATLLFYPEVISSADPLTATSVAGSTLCDVLLSVRLLGEDAFESLLCDLPAVELRRLNDLYQAGYVFSWYADWYVAKIQEFLKIEAAYLESIR